MIVVLGCNELEQSVSMQNEKETKTWTEIGKQIKFKAVVLTLGCDSWY